MKSQVQMGYSLDLTAPAGGVVSGSAYAVGGLVVVASTSEADGDLFAGVSEGVFELPKDAVAFTEGELIYWDDSAKLWKKSGSGFYPAGTCIKAAAGGDANVCVKLNGSAVDAVP